MKEINKQILFARLLSLESGYFLCNGGNFSFPQVFLHVYLALCLSCRKNQRKAILSDLRVNMCTCVRERQKKDYV